MQKNMFAEGVIKRMFMVLAVLSLALSGCATVVSGTDQNLTVITEKDVEGAHCDLTDKKGGTWHLPNTPGTLTVRKGDGPMTIVCKKDGYKSEVLVVEESFCGATLGNVILGGAVGIFIDIASGAAQQYPDKVIIWMEPKEWSSENERVAWLREKEQFVVEQAQKDTKETEEVASALSE